MGDSLDPILASLADIVGGEGPALQVLRSVLDREPDGVGLFEPLEDASDLRLVFADSGFMALKPFRQMTGRLYSEIWPELAAFAVPRFLEVARTGIPWVEKDIPLEVERASGVLATRYYTYEVSQLRVGERVFVLNVSAETTEEVRAREELVFQSALLENVSDSVFVYEFDEPYTGMLLYVNETAARQRGYTRDELMKLHVPDLIASDATGIYPTGLRALRDKEEFTGESVHVRKDGSTFPVEIRLRRITYRGRSVVINVSRDITVRKLIERQLSHALEEEQRVSAELIQTRSVVERELETTRLLLNAASAVAKWTDLHDVAAELANTLLGATKHRRAIVDAWDADRGEIVVLASAGEKPYPTDSRWHIDQVSVPARKAILGKERCLQDFKELSDKDRGISAKEYRLGQVLYCPLIQRDEVLGMVVLDDPDDKQPFTEREIGIVEAIASQAAVAIQNARLYEAQESRRRRIEALHGVMEVAVSSLDVRSAAAQILDYLVTNQAFDMANVWMYRANSLELVGSVGYPDAYPKTFSPMPMNSPYDNVRVFRSNKPIVVNDVATEGNPAVCSMYEVLGLELGAYVVLPLYSRGSVIGTLAFAWNTPRTIDADDLAFYDSIGHELGVVLENARLYEAEHDIADRLQEALIALPDEMPGLEYAHAYHSATETARVGGDFYDLFELGEDQVGIVIGDVAGKGLDAAVLTSVVKNTIRAHAYEPGKMPGRILELTNEILYRDTPPDSFVTVFLAMLDRRTGTLVYANGGHTTAAIAGEDGSVRGLSVTGSVLGAVPRIRVDEQTSQLAPGSLLMLYTDGLTEARHEKKLYGEARLFRILSEARGKSATETLRAVIADVMNYSGSRLRDDMAVLALKRFTMGAETPETGTLDGALNALP